MISNLNKHEYFLYIFYKGIHFLNLILSKQFIKKKVNKTIFELNNSSVYFIEFQSSIKRRIL